MTLSVIDSTWLTMPPSRTHSRRFALWCPGVSAHHPDHGGDTYAASVHQQSGTRSGNKITRAAYSIESHGPVPGAAAYQFLVEHLDPPTDRGPDEPTGPYLVVVGPNLHSCTCKAASCWVPCCLHRSVILAAIAEGLVNGVPAWPGIHDPGADATDGDDDAGRSGLAFEDEPGAATAYELAEAV